MSGSLPPLFIHDLRSPLARARTYAKLLREQAEGENAELADSVLQALEELERMLRAAEEQGNGG